MRCSAAVQLICIFVFVYAKVRFSNSAAHLDISHFYFEDRSLVLIVNLLVIAYLLLYTIIALRVRIS